MNIRFFIVNRKKHFNLEFSTSQSIVDAPLIFFLCFGEVLYYAINIFLLCFFISVITIDTGSIGDIAYNSPWYQMTHTEHVIIEMVIRRSQRPCELKGLGVIVCSLETYQRVMLMLILFELK